MSTVYIAGEVRKCTYYLLLVIFSAQLQMCQIGYAPQDMEAPIVTN